MKISALLAVGGVSLAGTTVLGSYHYFSNKNPSIRETLKGYKLISNLSKEEQDNQWGLELESDFKNIKEVIPALKGIDKKEEGVKILEKWCSEQMELDSVRNIETFESVKKYCLIRSISSQLSRQDLTLLGENEGQWKSTYDARKRSQKSSRSDVGLKGDWQGSNEQEDLIVIKEWCASHRERDLLASDKENIYGKFVLWCTVEGSADV